MKNTLILLGCMSIGLAHAQQTGRVGINAEKPRATLDIVGKPITNADKQLSRGVILPHISDAQKAEFTDKTEGLMIWNTTKKCIDFWNGTTWQCYGGTTNTTPPATTTYTGTAIWGDSAGETISATRNNCPAGQRGSTITYPANTSQHITYTATSTVSQADANQKALDLMNSTAKQQERQTLAQNYANANGTCSTTTYSATKTYTGSASFTRNNCGSNFIAGSVTYRATASGTATSTVSQADADSKALAAAQARYNTDGQAYANTNATCTPRTYTSTRTYTGSATFTRNNCPANTTAGSVVYNATASGTASSTVSQADADSKALANAQATYNTDGQNYANANASCTPLQKRYVCTVAHNNYWEYYSPDGRTGCYDANTSISDRVYESDRDESTHSPRCTGQENYYRDMNVFYNDGVNSTITCKARY